MNCAKVYFIKQSPLYYSIKITFFFKTTNRRDSIKKFLGKKNTDYQAFNPKKKTNKYSRFYFSSNYL